MITKLTPGELVQWRDGDAHHTGRVMLRYGLPVITEMYQDAYLVRASYSGDLLSVPSAMLSKYPSEPIPEPTK